MEDSHKKIVEEILPRLAERLKREGIISHYDRNKEEIKIVKHFSEIEIRPDLVLELLNGKRILVEVANLRDPKRFIGELMYPEILLSYTRIVAALVFVLGHGKQEMQSRSLSQIVVLHKFRLPRGLMTIGWSNEDHAFWTLRKFVSRFSQARGNRSVMLFEKAE